MTQNFDLPYILPLHGDVGKIDHIPANTVQRRRRRTESKPALDQYLVFAEMA